MLFCPGLCVRTDEAKGRESHIHAQPSWLQSLEKHDIWFYELFVNHEFYAFIILKALYNYRVSLPTVEIFRRTGGKSLLGWRLQGLKVIIPVQYRQCVSLLVASQYRNPGFPASREKSENSRLGKSLEKVRDVSLGGMWLWEKSGNFIGCKLWSKNQVNIRKQIALQGCIFLWSLKARWLASA